MTAPFGLVGRVFRHFNRRMRYYLGLSVVSRIFSLNGSKVVADRISVMHQGRIVQNASPVEVYRNPSEKFVAGFIGNPPMNFLPAAAASTGQWTVAGCEFAGPTAQATTIDFAIRPEDVSPAETGIKAVARVVEPLGAHLLVTCDVDGHLFRAVLNSDLAIRAGDVVHLAPQLDRIRWFDQSTTQAIC